MLNMEIYCIIFLDLKKTSTKSDYLKHLESYNTAMLNAHLSVAPRPIWEDISSKEIHRSTSVKWRTFLVLQFALCFYKRRASPE